MPFLTCFAPIRLRSFEKHTTFTAGEGADWSLERDCFKPKFRCGSLLLLFLIP